MSSVGPASIRTALLTPLAPAGITVVQVVGCGAVNLVQCILRDARNQQIDLAAKSGRLVHGYIVEASDLQRVDEVLVHWSTFGELAEPTCEVVDICCHGGVRPGQKIMEVLALAGAQPVEVQDLPGAGLAGLIALTGGSYQGVAGEVLSQLCRAGTDLIVRILLEQLEGGLTAELNRLLSEKLSVKQVAQAIDRLLATWTWGKRLTEPASVAITGLVNAGKSSLANLLSGQRGSIVTSQAGTTRDWVTHQTSLDGLPVILIDTAGHRHAADALEAEAIRRAIEQGRQADVQLLVIDGTSHPAHLPNAKHLSETSAVTSTVVAVNKADLDGWSFDVISPELTECTCVRTSAVTGLGREELILALLKALGCEKLSQGGPVVFTDRQRDCLQRAAGVLGDNSQPAISRLPIAKAAISQCLWADR